MNEQKTLLINGVRYNSEITMGALLDFKRVTGKEVSQVNAEKEFTLYFTLLFCTLRMNAKRDNVEFPFNDEIELGMYITLDDMKRFAGNAVGNAQENAEEGKK